MVSLTPSPLPIFTAKIHFIFLSFTKRSEDFNMESLLFGRLIFFFIVTFFSIVCNPALVHGFDIYNLSPYSSATSQSGSSPDNPNPSGSAIYFSYNSKSDFSYALKSDFIYSYGGTDNQRSLQSISATTENSDGISEPQISESVIHSVLKADKASGKTAKRPVQKAKPGGGGGNANRELRKICSKTEKPSLCVSTIAPRLRGGGANPRAVLDICIKASYDLAKSGAAKVKKLGVKECKGKFNDALSNFDLATKAFQKKDVGTMNSMLSAVVTDMSDCQDKLSGSGSPLIALGDKLATMTSNCLLIIPQMN
nr:pectinesterase inhibitor 3-like [Ipomoea batatas]GME08078.1 pectinesterase inhibitor 3-like [Ipomoea batatas]